MTDDYADGGVHVLTQGAGELQGILGAAAARAQLVLLDFSASWCYPCRMMLPVLRQLAEEHRGRLVVVKVRACGGAVPGCPCQPGRHEGPWSGWLLYQAQLHMLPAAFPPASALFSIDASMWLPGRRWIVSRLPPTKSWRGSAESPPSQLSTCTGEAEMGGALGVAPTVCGSHVACPVARDSARF
jgi:hypothetical protein